MSIKPNIYPAAKVEQRCLEKFERNIQNYGFHGAKRTNLQALVIRVFFFFLNSLNKFQLIVKVQGCRKTYFKKTLIGCIRWGGEYMVLIYTRNSTIAVRITPSTSTLRQKSKTSAIGCCLSGLRIVSVAHKCVANSIWHLSNRYSGYRDYGTDGSDITDVNVNKALHFFKQV